MPSLRRQLVGAAVLLASLVGCATVHSPPAVDASPAVNAQAETNRPQVQADEPRTQPPEGLVYRGTVKRNLAARRAFHRANPCPSTGSTKGACPGYVVDHIIPLCAGGADDPSNMQWQSREESHRKDAIERRMCAALKAPD